MHYRDIPNIIIEGADIMFRNFSGKETAYNREGERNFCVRIDDPEQAQKLAEDGWNIKTKEAREEGEEPMSYLQVTVSFKNKPPKVVMVTKRNMTNLDEEAINSLDFADIVTADITIAPYNWTVQPGTKNEKSGVKAYLKTLYVIIEEDEFAAKYAGREFPGEEPF